MKVMTALFGPIDAIERARALRDAGASGVFTFEGPHDVFAPLTLASTVGGLDLMTNVAIAFPRNPIHLAHQAIDHQLLTKGRFTLGLGTQIRTQIEKRSGRLRQAGGADDRAHRGAAGVFDAWATGERLNFRRVLPAHADDAQLARGELLPAPPIYVGALGPRLTGPPPRSTPAYRPVLDVHGWGELQPELNALSKQGRWQEMGQLIDDDMLHTIAACGSPADVAAHIRDRVDGVSDRICIYQPGPIAVESLAEVVDALNR